MIRGREWSIAQVPGKMEWRLSQVLEKKEGVPRFSPMIEHSDLPYGCRGNISLCFVPQEYYLYTDQFPKLKPELLALQVDKRFKDQGLTMESEGFVHRTREIDGNTGTMNSLFIRQQTLEDLYRLILPWKGVKQLRLVPLAAAIAGLIQRLTERAVIVLFLGKETSQVLVVQNGAPLYSQALSQVSEGRVEESLIAHAIDFAKHSVRRQHSIDISHVVRLGPCRGNLNLDELHIEEWQPDFRPVCRSQSPEEVLLYPGVYGAAFADSAYDFLPKEFASSWKIQRFSKMTTSIAALLAVGLFGSLVYLQPMVSQLQTQYQTLLAELTEGQKKINQRMPESGALDNFDRLVNIRSGMDKDYRLDILIRQISVSLPAQVHITSLEVKRIARDANGEQADAALPPPDENGTNPDAPDDAASALSVPEGLQSEKLKVTLSSVTSGSHDEINGRFQKAILGLNKYFTVQDMAWTYREADQMGVLRCVFVPHEQEGDS